MRSTNMARGCRKKGLWKCKKIAHESGGSFNEATTLLWTCGDAKFVNGISRIPVNAMELYVQGLLK
jgi:hypothetical protein